VRQRTERRARRPENAAMRRLLAAACALALLSGNAAAQLSAPAPLRPDAMMRELSAEVMAVLGKDPGAERSEEFARLLRSRVVPVFDFERMTRIALARNWNTASREQHLELTSQFRVLLVRTYSQALLGLSGQTVEFRPLRAAAGETEVTVRSLMRRSGVEPLTIDYEMADGPSGWRVFDVQIAGVSLVLAYRESFAATVRTAGVDGLIRALDEKNRQNAAGAASAADTLAPVLLLHGAARGAKP
jgi:phospholipid transport system substrate-binding protein